MYVMGENPRCPIRTSTTPAKRFRPRSPGRSGSFTETAYLADVVLAATAWPEKIGTVTNTDRMVQLGERRLNRLAKRRRTLDYQRAGSSHRR